MYSITPFTHGGDQAAPIGEDGTTRVGKFTHPSGAPDNDLLVVWTPGPANDLNRPTPLPYYDAGLYLLPGGDVVNSPDELVLLKNDPAYNEAWPRAVVPYSAVHGVTEPDEIPWLPNDGSLHAELPAGTPYGLIGTSSFYKRDSFPGMGEASFDGLDPFNTSENGASSNWTAQGSDAGIYTNADIWAVRIVALEPNTHRSYGPNNGSKYRNFANERHRILGEIPLRKFNQEGAPIMDPGGNPDTSFLAKIPADTPFTFQTLDRNGMVLNMAQTWHQVRPGEIRTNCGGCHAHSQMPLEFEQTAAAQPGYEIVDLSKKTPLLSLDVEGNPVLKEVEQPLIDVEFHRDIRPILERSCISCHTQTDDPPGNLVLDDQSNYSGLPGDYKRLADDQAATWGYKPVITFGPVWRQTNASRYIRMFQSRRSLLLWKIFGERLDGWDNADHPTETTPGDPSTLPIGAHPNEADIDYTGTIMPPPGSGVPPLTADEKMTFARWVDLGCPIDTAEGTAGDAYGWFLDDLRPVLTLSQPRAGRVLSGFSSLHFGMADANSGLDLSSLSVQTSFDVSGRAAGSELADLAIELEDGVWSIPINPPAGNLVDAHVYIEVADQQGNITRIDRKLSTVNDMIFLDNFE
jgi:hypothetical protein